MKTNWDFKGQETSGTLHILGIKSKKHLKLQVSPINTNRMSIKSLVLRVKKELQVSGWTVMVKYVNEFAKFKQNDDILGVSEASSGPNINRNTAISRREVHTFIWISEIHQYLQTETDLK